jgi:hypothetical protein
MLLHFKAALGGVKNYGRQKERQVWHAQITMFPGNQPKKRSPDTALRKQQMFAGRRSALH